MKQICRDANRVFFHFKIGSAITERLICPLCQNPAVTLKWRELLAQYIRRQVRKLVQGLITAEEYEETTSTNSLAGYFVLVYESGFTLLTRRKTVEDAKRLLD